MVGGRATDALVSQLAEELDSKPRQCGFESHRGHDCGVSGHRIGSGPAFRVRAFSLGGRCGCHRHSQCVRPNQARRLIPGWASKPRSKLISSGCHGAMTPTCSAPRADKRLVAPVPASDPLHLLPLRRHRRVSAGDNPFDESHRALRLAIGDCTRLAWMRTEVSLLMRPHVHARTVHRASRALTIAIGFPSPDRVVLVGNSRIRFVTCSGRSPISRCPVASKFAAGTVAWGSHPGGRRHPAP
jgi:hypothetical protein